MKLPKLKIKRGHYSGTNSHGHDVYGPPYYDIEEVKAFIAAAKTINKQLKKLSNQQ